MISADGRAMDPESVFGDKGVDDWVAELCCALIEYKPHIEEKLSRERRYDDFCAGISEWSDACLESSQALEPKARKLYGVCLDFGVIEWLRDEGIVAGTAAGGQREATRTRGAVRTRRATRTKEAIRAGRARPWAPPEAWLSKVAQSFRAQPLRTGAAPRNRRGRARGGSPAPPVRTGRRP